MTEKSGEAMSGDKTALLARTALLTAAALIVYVIEAQLPELIPVPGVKLGLSNVFTLAALCILGAKPALSLLIVRVILGSLVTGQPAAIIYSLSGAIPAFVLSLLLYKRFSPEKLWVLSAFAALCHNLGQLIMAIIVLRTAELLWYLPVLVISGIITGVFTGLAAQFLISRMAGFESNKKKPTDQGRQTK
jgi:heptaprenyl diphosphate synthase